MLNNRLEITLFGGLQIRHNDHLVTDLVSRKAEALLAYVAYTQRVTPRDLLADLFWDDHTQAQATGNLRVALNSLRNKVEPFVIIDRYTVSINRQSDIWVDVLAFEQLLTPFTQPGASGGELTPLIIAQLEKALALYQGELLAGFFIRQAPQFDEWARIERERLHILAMKAVQVLSLHYLATHQYGLGINTVERWLHFDLLSEEAHRTLMLLLAQEGHRSAAIQHFERIVTLFRNELGSDPSAETEALYHQILDDALPPVLHNVPVAVSPMPLTLPNNLEAALSPIIGRERELAQILERLQTPACRLLTLVGIGGVGKTRLAMEGALLLTQTAATQSLFTDGIFWVRLEHVENDSLLLSTLAQAVQYTFQGPSAPAKQLLEFLRRRRLLLVLDNLEQLTEQSDLILQILQSAPSVKLLVTSRERLNFQGEWLLEVNGLPYPARVISGEGVPAEVTQADWRSYSAPQLFIQCATALVADFDALAQRDDIIQICQLMEGMPLGIQLAAASTRAFTCRQILTAIQQNLDFLSSSMRNLPVRHRSLRAVFDHSWLLLVAAEKDAFQRLAIFEGSFTAQTAIEVAEVPPNVLMTLIDKSLVHVMPSEVRGTPADTAINPILRYRMHPVLHQYAREKMALASNTGGDLFRRYALYYGRLMADHAPLLHSARAAQASTLIRVELGNIRKGWQTGVRLHLIDILRRALPGLVQYYRLSGLFQEGQTLIAATLEALSGENSDVAGSNPVARLLIAHLLAHQAELLIDRGLYEEAIAAATSTIALAQANHDPVAEAMGYLQWGVAHHRQAAYEASDEKLTQALQIALRESLPQIQADAHLSMGRNRFYQGDYAGGQIHHEQAIAHYRANGDLVNELAAYNSLAMFYLFAGEYVKAKLHYERCLHDYRLIGNRPAIGLMLNNLGALAAHLGNYTAAQRYYEESLALRRVAGGRLSEALVLANLGLTCHRSGDNARALECCQIALQLSIELGERDTEAYARLCLGHALAGLGRWSEAFASYQLAVTARRATGQPTQALEPLAGLARVALSQHDLTQAKLYVDEIIPHLGFQTYAGIVELIRVYLTCYQVLAACQDPQAATILEMGYAILQERATKIEDVQMRETYLQITTHAELAVAYEERGDRETRRQGDKEIEGLRD